MYEIVTGVPPFRVENFRAEQIMWGVLDGMRPTKPENAEIIGFGRGVWNLVEQCWMEDRTQRPTASSVRQRLVIAQSLSSVVPPGPMVVVREAQADSRVSSMVNLFDDVYQQITQLTQTEGVTRKEAVDMTDKIPALYSNVRFPQLFERGSGCSTASIPASSLTASVRDSALGPLVPRFRPKIEL